MEFHEFMHAFHYTLSSALVNKVGHSTSRETQYGIMAAQAGNWILQHLESRGVDAIWKSGPAASLLGAFTSHDFYRTPKSIQQ
jgi:hypothetical protein